MILAVDAMGGDKAPSIVFEGLKQFRRSHPDVAFRIYGHKDACSAHLEGIQLSEQDTFIHCDDIISGDTEPRAAIRELKDSSMRRAVEAVALGEAQGIVSAGNTGAYMVLSKVILKTLSGISKPAITTVLPTADGVGVTMLDLGANVEVPADVLVQFCVMGQVFSRCVQGIEKPSCGLLNIGSEALKGTVTLKEAHALIESAQHFEGFYGYIEGDQIFSRVCDVVVTDGFTGNVALKTVEGTAKLCGQVLKEEFYKTTWRKFLGLMNRPIFNSFKQRLDPRHFNGAQFLGLRGVAVKSHGGTDGLGFANALKVTHDLIKHGVNDMVSQEIAALQEHLEDLQARKISLD